MCVCVCVWVSDFIVLKKNVNNIRKDIKFIFSS